VAAAAAKAMDVTHTAERAASRVRVLSGGFQRRVNIAAAILADPKLLVLDEPTVGVDQPAREAISEALRRLRESGVGILLVTHDLDQAEGLADRVGFLRDGEKVLEGAPAALIAEAFGGLMEVEANLAEASASQDATMRGEGLHPGDAPGAWVCLQADGYAFAARLAERLAARGVVVREIRVRRPSLQQLFAQMAEGRRAA
jgi:ABC-2 type transport system ATP-binding protein